VRAALAEQLADAFLETPWTAEAIAESAAGHIGGWPPWLEALTLSVVAVFRTAPADDRWALRAASESFLEEHAAGWDPPPAGREPPQPGWAPVPAARASPWPVAEVGSVAALAERLELSDGQLAWLADVRGWERTVTAEKLRNYRYRTVPRR